MRKIRNPRYAPEFLEKKLSPSSFGYVPAPAVQVGALTLNDDPPTYPPDEPTPPDPIVPTNPPGTPGVPTDPC